MSDVLQILLVEDQPSDADVIMYELRRSGIAAAWTCVETKEDYEAALASPYDVILADYSLPQFDGLQALELLRERGLDTPFLIVSGSIGEELAVEAIKRGAADYLIKDRLTRLGVAVTQAIEQQKLRRERKQAEQVLRDSEVRTRDYYQYCPRWNYNHR